MTDLALSSSPTFTNALAAKANLSGATFTGAISRDAQFYLDLAGTNARVNFDSGCYFDLDRSSDTLYFATSNSIVSSIDNAGNLSARTFTSRLYGGQTLGVNNGNYSYITFDGQPTRIEFKNTNPYCYVFYIGSKAVMSIDGSGNLKIAGTLSQNSSSVGS